MVSKIKSFLASMCNYMIHSLKQHLELCNLVELLEAKGLLLNNIKHVGHWNVITNEKGLDCCCERIQHVGLIQGLIPGSYDLDPHWYPFVGIDTKNG